MSISTFTGLMALLTFPLGGNPQPALTVQKRPAFMQVDGTWADSTLRSLTMEEQVAQLMMVAAWSNKGPEHVAQIDRLIARQNIGGLIFFQGGPYRQAVLTNRYQNSAKTPLLIGMDLEWGLDMRLDSTFRYPRQMTLGALPNDTLIEQMGRQIAEQMKRLGVHVSFSPVADVNNNPSNPVINERSFGENRERVAAKSIAYMRGLQAGGVIATGKHFPGHGDTDADSHHTLPLIKHDRARLDSLELYPFKRLINSGLMAMMVAHLDIPALDSTPNTPTTLSKAVVTDLLQNKMGFEGLIFTDAMNMRGVADVGMPGELELRALLAGNDVLLFPQDPQAAINRIVQAVRSGEVDSAYVAAKCLKVLKAKEWAGLTERPRIALPNIQTDMVPSEADTLRQALFDASVTVLRNKGAMLPLLGIHKKQVVLITIGAGAGDEFQKAAAQHAEMKVTAVGSTPGESDILRAVRSVETADLVIVGVHGTSRSPKSLFGVSEQAMKLMRMVNDRKPTIVAHFGNPYRLNEASGMDEVEVLLVGYEDVPEAHKAAAKLIFGGITTKATLPVTVSTELQMGDGIQSVVPTRMGRREPEDLGVDGSVFNRVDSIVEDGIRQKAFPGCQVLVVKDGDIIFEKAYGQHIYENGTPVKLHHVYDLASITKVAATTLSLMRLTDEGRFNPDEPIGTYLPELKKESPVHAALTPRAMLSHQAGLPAWIPFYWNMLEDGKRKPGLFADQQQRIDDVEIAERVFIPKTYQDSIMPWIYAAEMRKETKYKYSDLGYYFMQRIIERLTGMGLNEYVTSTFYKPMGLRNIGYHPLDWLDKAEIVPTEHDAVWRERLVQGTVHDPGAAMLGGVAGHAGLFANAEDLAVIMQMLLNGGNYGGNAYLSQAVIDEYTKCQYCTGAKDENRRAMGFDKPFRHGDGGPTFQGISLESFGHSGFTGTLVWADPSTGLVYVFLSNRVYPTADNKKLIRMDIRTKIQEAIYAGLPPDADVDPALLASPLGAEGDTTELLSKKELRRLKKLQRKEAD